MQSPIARMFLATLLSCASTNLASADRLTYEKDVRPILKAHCFQCHGEEDGKKGGLDLRLRRFMVDGGDSGAAIVPGKPVESLLFRRVSAGEMPPNDKKLSSAEIAVIRSWIEQGAHTRRDEPESLDGETYFTEEELGFWAFQPIERAPLPAVESDRLRSPIDFFVLDQLQQNALRFSEPASRRTLIRRACFDLLGVPPTPEEVDAFLSDDSPGAYDKLIDRLLASPQYGERWGRHWLDVAGYADSEGYVDSDPLREWAYAYRDYVIQAFNGDMPFDQFVLEQMAGDELVPQPHEKLTPEQVRRLTATGFLRMSPDGTGAADAGVARNEVIADTINIMSTSLLGLTVGCARCHNHRYDPISQVDYYELRAILEPALDWKAWRAPNARRISLYTDSDRKVAAGIEARAQKAEQERAPIVAAHMKRTLYEELIKVPDEMRQTIRTAWETPAGKRTQQQIALLKQYPNIQNISEGSLYLYAEQRARRANEIAAVADKKEKIFIEQVLKSQPGAEVTAETLREFDSEGAALVAEYRKAAEICRRTDAKKQLADLKQAVNDIRATVPKEYFIRALTEPVNHTPKTLLFKRGNHEQPGRAVAPNELDILTRNTSVDIPVNDEAVSTSGRRLAYARNLTSGKHPLLARVIVNRIWLHHFGRGLVNTPGDFGQLGERPSHPRLLDWLAAEFMDSGWQVKRLHRLILTSHTWKQASTRSEELDTVDPDNKLYARQSIRRIESEIFRDAVLAVSGRYNSRMFGPPIPVMEDGVGQIVLGKEDLDGERKPRATSGLGADEHRRSVYVQVRRSRPLAVLETFDIATVAPNCTKRPASNVAPQSLLLMNSNFIVRYAQAFADRVMKEAGEEPAAQIRRAWSIAYADVASDDTISALSEVCERQYAVFQEEDDKLDEPSARRKALAVVCQALMGANQFIYVD